MRKNFIHRSIASLLWVSSLVFIPLAMQLACTTSPSVTKQNAVEKKTVRAHNSGFLGILYITETTGIRVQRVFPDSPAEKSGIRIGDLILAANHLLLNPYTGAEFRRMIRAMRPGTILELQVERRGRHRSIRARI